MEKIKDGYVWSTWVLVDKINPDMWYQMNVDRKVMEEILDTRSWNNTYTMVLARWDYYRDAEKGDILTGKTTFIGNRTIHNRVDYNRLPDDARFQIAEAIKRYTSWGFDNYDTVNIFNDGKNDMIGCFSDSKGSQKFTMGAVWHPKERIYTYHS